MLKLEIFLRIIFEKVKILKCDFAIIVVAAAMHGHTYKLCKIILNDAQTKDIGEINTA